MELCENCVNRVRAMVRSVYPLAPEGDATDDLVGDGLLGLAEAGERYAADGRASFWTYAAYRVRGRVMDALRRLAHEPSAARGRYVADSAADPGFNADMMAAGEDGGMRVGPRALSAVTSGARTIESLLTAREAALVLARALARLPLRRRQLVVECGLKGRPVLHVASELCISRPRARRLLNAALEDVRKQVRRAGYRLEDFV